MKAGRSTLKLPNSPPCECLEPGWCERHGCKKTPHWHHLCQTRDDYRAAWDAGHGPGQVHPAAGELPRDYPKVTTQAWDLAKSLAAFVCDGAKLVSVEEYQARLEICDVCNVRRGNRCVGCGCYLSIKARGRAFRCPRDKWPREHRGY
jgi:hypothetical protein